MCPSRRIPGIVIKLPDYIVVQPHGPSGPVLKVHANNQVTTTTILSDFQSLSTGTMYKRVMQGMKGVRIWRKWHCWYLQCNAAKPRVMQKPTHALAKIATGRSSTAHA